MFYPFARFCFDMLACVKFFTFPLALAFLSVGLQAQAQPAQNVFSPDTRLAVRQLIWPLESSNAFLNGQRITTSAPSRVLSGRAVLPLRETTRLLDLELEKISGTDGIRLGKLEIYPSQRSAKLDGKRIPMSDVAVMVDGLTYVAARAIENAVPASVAFDSQQRLLRLTISGRSNNAAPRLPVARFATDKPEYKLGEQVRLIEYSYDPDGLPLTSIKYVGREEAFFTPGQKTISLVVTNSAGRVSEPYSVQIKIGTDTMMSAREFALRRMDVGKTFVDTDVLNQAQLTPERQDESQPLLISDSPEDPDRSGVLYADTISGPARLLAYHTNGAPGRGRLVVIASNKEEVKIDVAIEHLGETAATQVVATLGQVSLLDFLLGQAKNNVQLEIDQHAPIYVSPLLERGEGLSLMMDLRSSGAVRLTVIFMEESLVPEDAGILSSNDSLQSLLEWPVLEMDSNHVRGTFPTAIRNLQLDLAGVPLGMGSRIVIGDNKSDPALLGADSITGRSMTLLGNFGLTYKLHLQNAFGTVGAFVPRGGPYSGAVRISNLYQALPESGVLYRHDTLALLYRYLARGFEGGDQPKDTVDLEFVPANGSYLPVNFVFYRIEALVTAQKPSKKL